MIYRIVILLHLVAVTVFLGSIVTGMLWKRRADRSGERELIAHAFNNLQFTDRVITPIAVVAIIATGVAAAWLVRLPILSTGWVFWSLVAFGASGLVFVLRVLPLQTSLARWTNDQRAFEPSVYHARSRVWAAWAYLSLAAAMVAFVLMVFRPALPTVPLG